ncbi:hypothetical protein [Streptacidiphilus carbonis]|jgi:hypothetical protein|uniref:hypothetical protein n=1 Tax=Streptacidiphilus carbonis TaxID=105422 RepID=UPI0005A80850|nr:hypothetical protein [Streptacidiphilus carbonis]
MSPWEEDRLLARTARFGEWWTLERLHEAFDGLARPQAARPGPETAPQERRQDTDEASAAA